MSWLYNIKLTKQITRVSSTNKFHSYILSNYLDSCTSVHQQTQNIIISYRIEDIDVNVSTKTCQYYMLLNHQNTFTRVVPTKKSYPFR